MASKGDGTFFFAAARAMRQILVDHARRKHAGKRGGGRQAVPLDLAVCAGDEPGLSPLDCIAISDALERLEALDAQQARVVELKVFGGRTQEEIAETLGVSVSTVKREWTMARAWLRREITSGGAGS